MIQFKPLQWHTHTDIKGLYAAPNGLKCRYSIIFHKAGAIEFAVLDSNFEYESGFPIVCESVENAKEEACKHYVSVIQNFIVS